MTPDHIHKDGTQLTGIEDGGISISFLDHPAHRRTPGRIEVSFSAKTIRRMKKLGRKAMKKAGYA